MTEGLAGRERVQGQLDNCLLIEIHSDLYDGSRNIESRLFSLMKPRKLDGFPPSLPWTASSQKFLHDFGPLFFSRPMRHVTVILQAALGNRVASDVGKNTTEELSMHS